MIVLGIDPATKCGWAVRDTANASYLSGTWDLSIRRDESAGMRLIRLKCKLEEIRTAYSIDVLLFEAARHAAPKMQGALVVQAELQGVIKLWCETQKIPYRGVSPSEVKKFATGKGNANKQAMLAAARAKWPHHHFQDDNEADARFIAESF